MAAASEAPMRIIPSYVSSNGYYGYVPPINEPAKHHNNYQDLQQQNQNQPTVSYTNNHSFNDVAACHRHNQQHYDYNNSLSAMETDEENCIEGEYCQNSHRVLPVTEKHLNDDDCGGGVGFMYRVAHSENNYLTNVSQRVNRKRNSYDDPALLGQMKKLRQDGGNKRVCHGTGSRRELGSTAVYNEPTSICLVFNRTSPQKRFPRMVDGRCTQAVGNNCLLIHDKPRENIHEVRENPITNAYNVEYETMLMETHGCSVYHHHRHHLLGTGTFEAEF
ncbi:uncharacterized protein [Chelonus insularis]|uniref:uncharacterized protein n=1 Tax=Chelonus insularis TaxID=460826 RepID=UPI00158D2F80|nr:uncharacterized protein LOC118075064 [Chelonus insularis]XP_034952583.1 uncharacterized protein LOC118075064 [Chelonus insularis]